MPKQLFHEGQIVWVKRACKPCSDGEHDCKDLVPCGTMGRVREVVKIGDETYLDVDWYVEGGPIHRLGHSEVRHVTAINPRTPVPQGTFQAVEFDI